VAAEPAAEVFLGLAAAEIVAQETLEGLGNQRRWATIADCARDGGLLADCSAEQK